MKAIYVSRPQIDETLMTPPAQGKRGVEPFLAFAKTHNLPFQILEDTNVSDNNVEIHHKEDDLWQCLEGEAIFLCDGKMGDTWLSKHKDGTENSDEVRSKTIVGGVTYVLKPGDWLWIPAGVPHQHSAQGTARLVIVKIPR